jgi:NAD(P)-dependent dehydrogenase (short-subunit alcohol dehydrogenase family)
MKIEGTRAIVTGAAGGIGAAIAQRLLDRGASVLLTDLDADRLATTTADLDGSAIQLAGDVGDTAHLSALIAAADESFGGVDLFVANAGVFHGFGLDADEQAWATSWDVNVMAHVRAARLLVPRWVDGESPGCFAVTASAAGLLTQLGSPTYSTTKHAAVGFAEWLAATYGDRGVQVTALCPMGVRTQMIEAGEVHEDPDARLGHAAVTTAGETLTPEEVADSLLDAIEAGRFLALPHASVAEMYAKKAADPDQWLSGMQWFRSSLS